MNKYRGYLYSFLLTLLFLIVIFVLNHVYPFGNHTIINGDLGKAYVPVYYYMYDVLMGKANLFIDFKIGMGSNMYDLTSIYGIFSPVSWLLVFSSRSHIPYFLSYILIIKICLISLTSFYFFNKIFKKVELFWKVLFSVMYGFSGYVIVYHTNIVWLDNVVLFPILLLGLKKIFDDGNYHIYTFVLFLSIILSYYISFMEIIFIIFCSFGYIVFLCDKDDKKKIVFKLGVGTLLAIGMSLFCLVPVIIQTGMSIRMHEAKIQLHSLFLCLSDKLLILFFYGFPIVLYIYMLKSKFVKKNIKKFFLYLFVIFVSAIIFDPINMMWHTGSYLCFPLRYGFIVIMVLYIGCLYYLTLDSKLDFSCQYSYFSVTIFSIIFIAIVSFFIPVSSNSNPSTNLLSFNSFFAIFLSLLGIMISYFILNMRSLKWKRCILSFFLIFYGLSFSLGYIGIYSNIVLREDTEDIVFRANDYYEFLKHDSNGILRYKNLDNNLFENYSFITNTNSLSSWKMVDASSAYSLDYFGYTPSFILINEMGGTLFSDNLLGINKYVSSVSLNDNIYDKGYSNEGISIYQLKNYLGYGFIYENPVKKIYYKNSVDYQNQIYREFFRMDDNILDDAVVKEEVEKSICVDKNKSFTYYVHVDNFSELYFYFENLDYNNLKKSENVDVPTMEMKINDQVKYFPNMNYLNNTKLYYNNRLNDLGNYYNEEVKIELLLKKDTCIHEFKFVTLNVEKLNSFINSHKNDIIVKEKGNSLHILADSDSNNDYLFLPINYLNGYEGIVNGKKVSVKKILNNFVGIPLVEGNNDIILTYYPPYITTCSVISFMFFIAYVVLFRFRTIVLPDFVYFICLKIYYFVVLITFIYIYLFGFLFHCKWF